MASRDEKRVGEAAIRAMEKLRARAQRVHAELAKLTRDTGDLADDLIRLEFEASADEVVQAKNDFDEARFFVEGAINSIELGASVTVITLEQDDE